MATHAHTTRRQVLKALPAAGAATLIPAAALALPPAETDTPILRLFRQHQAALAAAHVASAAADRDEDHDQFYAESDRLEAEMMALTCTCAADFAAKAVVDTCEGQVFPAWEHGALWVEARALVEEASGGMCSFPAALSKQAVTDPHPAWLAEWRRLRNYWDGPRTGDIPFEATEAWCDLGDDIAHTRAVTPWGMAAQLELAIEDTAMAGYDLVEVDVRLLKNVLASLRALA